MAEGGGGRCEESERQDQPQEQEKSCWQEQSDADQFAGGSGDDDGIASVPLQHCDGS